MGRVQLIEALTGLEVVPTHERAWGPHGTLVVENIDSTGQTFTFDVLVPTERADIWDYIWSSERDAGSTEKVQLFQAGSRISGGRVTAVAREGQDERWGAEGPEQYRLSFLIPDGSLHVDEGIEVRFFWSDELMATAGPNA